MALGHALKKKLLRVLEMRFIKVKINRPTLYRQARWIV